MKELVEVLAQSLVDHPEEVTVTETDKDNEIILELKVDPDDMGKVIGKQGRIAKAIRAMVKAAASKTDKKVVVEIGYCPKRLCHTHRRFCFYRKTKHFPINAAPYFYELVSVLLYCAINKFSILLLFSYCLLNRNDGWLGNLIF